ncbi:MAG: hypothetical protein Q9160_006936 [Pyrenula sp. 1 TL-2023]
MVYYIRFFKLPKFVEVKGKRLRSIIAVITVQNDLGDLFLHEPTKLRVQLLRIDKNQNETICREQLVDWLGEGIQSLAITLNSVPENDCYKLYVSERLTSAASTEDFIIPRIIPGWSGLSSHWDVPAEALIERRFLLPPSQTRLKDEQDNTHLKLNTRQKRDAALGSVLLFHHLVNASLSRNKDPFLPQLHAHLNELHHPPTPPDTAQVAVLPSPPRVIELGSGTGLTGIYLSKVFSNLGSILLTDLSEAQDLLSRNISFNISTYSGEAAIPAIANHASVHHSILRWGEQFSQAAEPIDFSNIYLILTSDVTYNPASYIPLINTFTSIINMSNAPRTLILVSMKRRHESEEAFFVEMSKAEFRVIENADVALSVANGNDGDGSRNGGERIEFWVFELTR